MTALTLAQQASLTAGAAMWRSVAIPEVGIPSLHMSDGPMGIAAVGSTNATSRACRLAQQRSGPVSTSR
ncbi:Uncharacterised protein [Sphingomonas paucimobilis]|nr:Uncharacterised protein [Sphingomonas paucimobilis]